MPEVDESSRPGESAQALVGRLAVDKVQAVALKDDEVAIAADTVVVLDGDVLGKPGTASQAEAMLARLSGRAHAVLSGVAVRRGDEVVREVVRTGVTFRPLRAEEIRWYVASGEPMDKAGGYGIQGGAAAFVTSVHGSDTNVIGLPLATVIELTRRVGVELLA